MEEKSENIINTSQECPAKHTDYFFYATALLMIAITILPIYIPIPVYIQLISDAFCCIYIGSKLSSTTDTVNK